MRAAVCHEFGKPLVVEELDDDSPRGHEVRVRITAVSICFCDLHVLRGDLGGQVPLVAGHEAAGVVEEAGREVTTAKTGDAVVVSSMSSCGRCRCCVSGAPHLCFGELASGTPRPLRSRGGAAVHRFALTGAFAEEVVVDESQVVPVPKEMPADRAALLGCTVITGVGAVVNTACVEPGDSVAVVGCGAIGLNVIQGAALVSAHPIVAIDFSERRLGLARTFGASHTIEAGASDGIREQVAKLTGGGADYAFVTAGTTEAIASGFELLGRRGTEVVVGFASRGAEARLPVNALISGEKRVVGTAMGSSRYSVDVPWLVNLYLRGALRIDELISGRYSLDEINRATGELEKGSATRNVILL